MAPGATGAAAATFQKSSNLLLFNVLGRSWSSGRAREALYRGRALIKANLRGTVPKLELPGFLISMFGVLRWSHALMNYAKKSTDVRIYPG